MRHFFLPISFLLFTAACENKQQLKDKQQELTKGSLDEKSQYSASEVGWTVHVPQDWHVLTKKETANLNEKGKDLVEESTGNEIDYANLNVLINLQKDAFNGFTSTMEDYSESETDYPMHNTQVNEILKQTYEAKNIPGEYEESKMEIDGLQFDVFTARIYDYGKANLILTQKMFSRLINHYDFCMTINYNNKTDEKTLMDMVKYSKFTKR